MSVFVLKLKWRMPDVRLLLSLIALIYRKLVAGLKTIITSASGGAGNLVLLAINIICPRCNIQCNEQNSHNVDGKIWRCMQKQCKKKISIRVGSFFERSQLKLWQIIGITYIWTRSAGKSRGLSVEDIQKDLEVGSNKTVVDWNQFCRDIGVTYFLNNRVQLGGPGSIVEIDESIFSRRK